MYAVFKNLSDLCLSLLGLFIGNHSPMLSKFSWRKKETLSCLVMKNAHTHTQYVHCCIPVTSNPLMCEAEGYSPMEFLQRHWLDSVNTNICVRFLHTEVRLIYWYTTGIVIV